MTELRNAIEEASREHYKNYKEKLRQSEFCPSIRQFPGELSVSSFNYCFVSSVLESSTGLGKQCWQNWQSEFVT